MVASVHEQLVPIFQQLARSHPSGRDDVREISAVAAQRRGSLGQAWDRHQPETVRFWWNRFGPMFAAEIHKRHVAHRNGYPLWRWHLDEVLVKVNGTLLALAAVAALRLPGNAMDRPVLKRQVNVRALFAVPGFLPLMALAALVLSSHALHDGFEGGCHVNLALAEREVEGLALVQAAVSARHVWKASSRKTRCVRRDVRWRWTLNAFWTAAWTDRNRWADPGDLNRCILRSRRRTGRCEFSARLFLRRPCSWRAVNLSSDFAAV